MIRVHGTGPQRHLESTLCSACPVGVTGCCAAPPVIAWADLGRIVLHGGADWLLEELADGRLEPCARGLGIRRVPNPDSAATGLARKCVYHGPSGCTIASDRRSATCNYYVCDDALAGSSPALRDQLAATYGAWDLTLAERLASRCPTGVRFDRELLVWLGEQMAVLMETASGPHGR